MRVLSAAGPLEPAFNVIQSESLSMLGRSKCSLLSHFEARNEDSENDNVYTFTSVRELRSVQNMFRFAQMIHMPRSKKCRYLIIIYLS